MLYSLIIQRHLVRYYRAIIMPFSVTVVSFDDFFPHNEIIK